jgi:hypothetical protein
MIFGFQHKVEAERFLAALRSRLEQHDLTLRPDKTRLIEFGRYAAERRRERGLGKPETFDFRGFTYIAGRDRRGVFQLKRKTRRGRKRTKPSLETSQPYGSFSAMSDAFGGKRCGAEAKRTAPSWALGRDRWPTLVEAVPPAPMVKGVLPVRNGCGIYCDDRIVPWCASDSLEIAQRHR